MGSFGLSLTSVCSPLEDLFFGREKNNLCVEPEVLITLSSDFGEVGDLVALSTDLCLTPG